VGKVQSMLLRLRTIRMQRLKRHKRSGVPH
jgi:hypothetical protein